MNTTSSNSPKTNLRLTRRRIFLAALLLIVVGYLLMSGTASTGQAFRPEIFSERRIVLAPMLCFSGYLLIIVGILRKR